MSKTIYTIGYAGFSRDNFVKELKKHNISVLIDVRSTPYSAFHSEYDKEALNAILKNAGIYYRNYAGEFGARRDDKSLYSSNGILNFEKVAETDVFKSGVIKLYNSMNQGYTPALMCAEKKPIDCHRAILVSKAFYDSGCNVIHLLPDDKICSQNDLDRELLDMYFPNREQLSMFGNSEDAALLKEAYRKQNQKIGFKAEDLH